MKKIILILVLITVSIITLNSNNLVKEEISNERIVSAKQFIKKNNYNDEYCIFVDFSKETKSKRFILYNIKKDMIIYSCKCAHGNTSSDLETNINSFSNKRGSNKSSLGKYRIGRKRTIKSVNGLFNVDFLKIPCYEMHGLEKSNSNAYSRGILIHPMPFSELPIPILAYNSLGCFSLSVESFNIISKYLDKSKKPVLLWAYYK